MIGASYDASEISKLSTQNLQTLALCMGPEGMVSKDTQALAQQALITRYKTANNDIALDAMASDERVSQDNRALAKAARAMVLRKTKPLRDLANKTPPLADGEFQSRTLSKPQAQPQAGAGKGPVNRRASSLVG